MIIDTSAIVALVFQEPDHERVERALERATGAGIAAPTLVETAIVLSARLGRDARGLLARLLSEVEIDIVPFGEAHYAAAIDAWLRFGKGRHPAALNLGDCMTYSAAKLAAAPLLCVGADFCRTDLELA